MFNDEELAAIYRTLDLALDHDCYYAGDEEILCKLVESNKDASCGKK